MRIKLFFTSLLVFILFSSLALAKLNLNNATESELTSLKGIGKVKAQRIIEYRKTKGKFKNIEELKNVKGIGDKLFQTIKEEICVDQDCNK